MLMPVCGGIAERVALEWHQVQAMLNKCVFTVCM